MKKRFKVRGMVVMAIMSALGFVLMMLNFPIPVMPGFIKFDFSELPAIITSFALGPWYGVGVCFFKNFLHLIFNTSTSGVGELSNFLLGSIYVLAAGYIYKRHKSFKTAVIGTVIGSVGMAILGIITNYFIVYPFYAKVFMPYEAILGMYTAILPSADTLIKALLIFNLPFTFAKGMADAIICFACYKKLSPILKGNKT